LFLRVRREITETLKVT
jgi:serine/threonine protein kinase